MVIIYKYIINLTVALVYPASYKYMTGSTNIMSKLKHNLYYTG